MVTMVRVETRWALADLGPTNTAEGLTERALSVLERLAKLPPESYSEPTVDVDGDHTPPRAAVSLRVNAARVPGGAVKAARREAKMALEVAGLKPVRVTGGRVAY